MFKQSIPGTVHVKKEDAALAIKRVVIWGASLSGSDCLKRYRQQGIEVAYFVDRRVQGETEFQGVPLYPVERLLQGGEDKFDAVILAMGVDPTGPRQQLREAGINKPILSFRQGMDVTTEVEQYLSPNRAIQFDGSDEDYYFLSVIRTYVRAMEGNVAIWAKGTLAGKLFQEFPELYDRIRFQVSDKEQVAATCESLKPLTVEQAAQQSVPVIIAETGYLAVEHALDKLKEHCPLEHLITLSHIFADLPCHEVPPRAYIPIPKTIYPIDIPLIHLTPGTDFALLDLPPRFFGMMPNGLGYVHNSLEQAGVSVQTLDLDMIFYHRFHAQRILDGLETITGPNGYEMKQDPWSIDVIIDEWQKREVIDYFSHEIEQLVATIVEAKPKIIGLSLHGTNLAISKEVVRRIRSVYPEGVIIVGGYDCIRPEFGPKLFDDFDYMVIFEAEMSLPGLVKELLSGKRPKNKPGIIARNDRPELPFVPAPVFEELDSIPFPRYQWTNIRNYRNYNGFQTTPIVLSRGCRWSRCIFCAERFSWRRRDPAKVVDEIEWLAEQGRSTFVFNDSDLSGDPAAVREVCEEVINRGVRDITLSGQLRVQKGYSQEYFDTLARAGFNTLTYGIDGWSKNTLKLHKKGYTISMIEEVVKCTANAGITVSMNLVVGVPGETDQDIDETIENILKNKQYIDGIENLNTLILSNGSIYWEQPERFGIRFRGDRRAIYQANVKMIPTDLWYSVDPYIDQPIRLDRVRRIVEAARQADVRIGSFSEWKLNKLESA